MVLSLEDQRKAFDAYWHLGSYSQRLCYLSKLIEIKNKVRSRKRDTSNYRILRKYSVNYNIPVGSRVVKTCKKCFLVIFDETDGIIRTILKKLCSDKNSDICRDNRGRNPPANKTSVDKIEEVNNHIRKFPAYESHYSRSHTSRKYLPSGLNVSIMYDLYTSENLCPVSLSTYRKMFNQTGLRFKPPKIDTCHKCDQYAAQLQYESNTTIRNNILSSQKSHHEQAEFAYKSKALDKKQALTDDQKRTLVCSFDLQQCLPTPMLKTCVAFYKRPLWTYNLTISDSTRRKTICYMWHEAIGKRGSNDIASCLNMFLKQISNEVQHIIFYSDSCGGQNKNNIVAAMFLSVMESKLNLQTIDHKFLVPGHTHMECDVDHAIIERAKKKCGVKIDHPRDWYQLVRNAKRKTPFDVVPMTQQDFKKFDILLKGPLVVRHKNMTGNPFIWQNVKWLRYTKEYGVISYKESLDEKEPFLKLDLRRKRNSHGHLCENLKLLYDGPQPISEEKKQDLLSMLSLIDPEVRSFYTQLTTERNIQTIDPDINLLEVDETDNVIEEANLKKRRMSSKQKKINV